MTSCVHHLIEQLASCSC